MLFHVFFLCVMSFDTLDDCVCAFFIIIALRIPVECALWECPTWCLVRFRPFTCIHTVNMHTQLTECHRTSANIYISIISINETWMSLNCNWLHWAAAKKTQHDEERNPTMTSKSYTPHNSCIKFHFSHFPLRWLAQTNKKYQQTSEWVAKKKCIRTESRLLTVLHVHDF